MKQVTVDRFETIASGDVYYCYGEPVTKQIDGVTYIGVTPDFHRLVYIRQDSVKKNGKVSYDL